MVAVLCNCVNKMTLNFYVYSMNSTSFYLTPENLKFDVMKSVIDVIKPLFCYAYHMVDFADIVVILF